ncbi:MAG: dihydroorotate dehydrogenase electron transfer subunit, partial [Phycisphaerae bacterium]|nr:dihydroorotate dehydrogenase electron transfer subunit [Phycisphaerae bacterium]
RSGAVAFSKTIPGQFCQINLAGVALPPEDDISEHLRDSCTRNILLRRPFSFSDISVEKDKTIVELLYCAIGPATLRMTTLKEGDSLDVIGPLGNGFAIVPEKQFAILAVGGVGAGPLIHLAKEIKVKKSDTELIAFAGAKTKADLPYDALPPKIGPKVGSWLPQFTKSGVDSVVATDDGSAGNKGFVTECVASWISQMTIAAEKIIIYACGPEAMLATVARIAAEHNIDCQVSMERMMACGIDLCQSCAVECKEDDSKVYKMCCKDGPVFNSRNVIFD